MMSQVKNSNRSHRPQVGLTALALSLLTALALFLPSCKNTDANDPEEPKANPQEQVADISGNVAQPDWQLPADYDMTSSLTAIVKVDLALSFQTAQLAGWKLSDNDRLAAFQGNNCLGVAAPKDGLFFLYVTAPKDGNTITLKYYAASVKNGFDATQTLIYKNDDVLGSVAKPFTPQWTVAK